MVFMAYCPLSHNALYLDVAGSYCRKHEAYIAYGPFDVSGHDMSLDFLS